MKNRIHVLIIGMICAILFNFLVANIASFSLKEVGYEVSAGVFFTIIMVAAVRFGKAPKNAPVILRAGVFQDVWVGWMHNHWHTPLIIYTCAVVKQRPI